MMLQFIPDNCNQCNACALHFPGLMDRLQHQSSIIERDEVAAAFAALRACRSRAIVVDDREDWQ